MGDSTGLVSYCGRLLAHSDDDDERIKFAYELLFARPASVEDVTAGQQFLSEAAGLLQDSGVAGKQIEPEAWNAYVRALFRLNEFVYID